MICTRIGARFIGRYLPLAALLLVMSLGRAPRAEAQFAPVADIPFAQEYRDPFLISSEADANNVFRLAMGEDGKLWLATAAGLRYVQDGAWETPAGELPAGPALDVAITGDGQVLFGAWDGAYRVTDDGVAKLAGTTGPINRIAVGNNRVVLGGPDGVWEVKDDTATPLDAFWASSIMDIAVDGDDTWLATIVGTYHLSDDRTRRLYESNELLTCQTHAVAVAPNGKVWIGTDQGLNLYRNGEHLQAITGEDGLPVKHIRSISFAPDETVWIGTPGGLVRYRDGEWALRHSLRWLPNDDVRDVAFGKEGDVYVATAGGVGVIRQRQMTLAEKAAHYQQIVRDRHVREPGLVEVCRLQETGDLASFAPRDTDNDGLFTGLYIASEAYRWAVTGDEQAKANAQAAFKALAFLQEVTETPGFIARTVIPSDWKDMADRNRSWTELEAALHRLDDPRFKPVETRWRKSADGKWLWKGDTSSDEVSGHYYAWGVYYDLVADEEEKEAIRDLVARVTDYIVDGGFVFRDIDGQATRWGVWAPELLNGNPNWSPDRGVNSVEILSFLTVAEHITGNQRYAELRKKLLDEHNYRKNILKPQTTDPGQFTHIDSQLLGLAYRGLFAYEQDPELRELYHHSMRHWYDLNRRIGGPFYNFIYGGAMESACDEQRATEFLRRVPLDMIRWSVDNRNRSDVNLVNYPQSEALQVDRLLPPDERHLVKWDGNHYSAVGGSAGREEDCGVFWLLPYWMGRYYGYIAPPGEG